MAADFAKLDASMREQAIVPFRSLMEGLGFDKNVTQSALKVLSEHQAAVANELAKSIASGKPPELSKLTELDRVREEGLRTALGEANYAEYQYNLPTLPERMALSSLESRLQVAGQPLNDQQANQILEEMIQAVPTSEGSSLDPYARFETVGQALSQSSAFTSAEQRAVVERFIMDGKTARRQVALPKSMQMQLK